jgi:glyoxylase-like metal-dependent hydrolase (beta-lactamase superfamily II)
VGGLVRIGEIDVRPVSDFDDQAWPADVLLPDSIPAAIEGAPDHAPPESYIPRTDDLRLQFGGFLFEVDGQRILVDTGVGAGKERSEDPEWHLRTDTSFLDSLALPPGEIDVVVTTHLHVDHVGWLTVRAEDDWVPTFPNAQHVFVRDELTYWLERLQDDPGVNFGSTRDSVLPVVQQADTVLVDHGAELASGVTVTVHPGHTPGAAVVWLESGNEVAALCGDMVHHPIQLRYPEWSSAFCVDPRLSARARRSFLDAACDSRAVLLPSHFRTAPTRIARSSDHYVRVPLAA